LEDLLDQGHYIPRVVKAAIDYLKRNHLDEKNLFIVETNREQLQEYIQTR
jgi:NAD(P)H-dependent FMN reductase